MHIRLTKLDEAPEIVEVFNIGRQMIRESGNNEQWVNGYPDLSVVLSDIQLEQSYVCVSDEDEIDTFPQETILGTFCLQKGIDPTYLEIDGQWLNEEPYVTIHRISTNRKYKGVAKYCMDWAQSHYENIRVDTHEKNGPMRLLLLNKGFDYCGIIYIADRTSRLAYQWLNKD